MIVKSVRRSRRCSRMYETEDEENVFIIPQPVSYSSQVHVHLFALYRLRHSLHYVLLH